MHAAGQDYPAGAHHAGREGPDAAAHQSDHRAPCRHDRPHAPHVQP